MVPGGGTFETVVFTLLVLLLSKTSPPIVVITVPLTVNVPPSGAFGGIVLLEALAARPMKASSVLPDVGLHKSAGRNIVVGNGGLRVDASNHSSLTVSLLGLGAVEPDGCCVIDHNLEGCARWGDSGRNEATGEATCRERMTWILETRLHNGMILLPLES